MQKTPIDPILPSGHDAILAGELRHALEERPSAPLRLQVGDAKALELPPLVTQLLMSILEETAAGHAVTLVPVEAEITTQQAADLLNVSRPHLVTLIEKGLLPSRMVGNQRRLPLNEVLIYKTDNRAKRRKSLSELVAHDQKLGLL